MTAHPLLYDTRSPAILDGRGGHYTRHFWAIERERLRLDRETVAAELAYRDMLIADLEMRLRMAGDDRPLQHRRRVIEALEGSETGMSAPEIARVTGLQVIEVRNVIKVLRKYYADGVIRVVSDTRPRRYKAGPMTKSFKKDTSQ